MPGYDRTGPVGAGPMTGGSRGRCVVGNVPYGRPYFRNRGTAMGRGMGYGCGFGRGGSNQPFDATYPMSAGEEINRLKAEAAVLRNDLDRINRQISNLEGTQAKEE